MAFINFNTKNRVTIFPGIHSAMQHSEHITIANVVLEKGVVVPVHQHEQEQWTYILEGQMEFTLDGQVQLLEKGMAVYVPGNVPHGARAVEECRVMDVFTPVREDYKALE